MSSSPFNAKRGDGPDGPDGKPGGHGFGEPDYLPDGTLDAFEAAATAAEQLPTTGHDQPGDSYVPGSYSYPTPRPDSRLGF